ncbi:MAG: nitronate monooxygenase, partial [gamma proteobacterium symbiont of Bathyaustriella thionipta]|nr:nitronate monooxygenase [gamma proteobacterium symbiont of Bathyaustriella thionipta]
MKEAEEFCQTVGIEVPLIGGAMYPCSNPELVAAISEAGAIGIIQPLSLSYVHGYEFRAGLDYLRTLTQKPLGLNLISVRQKTRYFRGAMTPPAVEFSQLPAFLA